MKFVLTYDKMDNDSNPQDDVIKALALNGVKSLLLSSEKVLYSTIEFEHEPNDVQDWMNAITKFLKGKTYIKLYCIQNSSGLGRTDLDAKYKQTIKEMSSQGIIEVNQHIQ